MIVQAGIAVLLLSVVSGLRNIRSTESWKKYGDGPKCSEVKVTYGGTANGDPCLNEFRYASSKYGAKLKYDKCTTTGTDIPGCPWCYSKEPRYARSGEWGYCGVCGAPSTSPTTSKPSTTPSFSPSASPSTPPTTTSPSESPTTTSPTEAPVTPDREECPDLCLSSGCTTCVLGGACSETGEGCVAATSSMRALAEGEAGSTVTLVDCDGCVETTISGMVESAADVVVSVSDQLASLIKQSLA